MRRKKVIPSVRLNLALPITLRSQIDLKLFSDLEGRVPEGAYQKLFSRLIRQDLEWKELPLEPFGFPSGMFVAGPEQAIESLKQVLTTVSMRS